MMIKRILLTIGLELGFDEPHAEKSLLIRGPVLYKSGVFSTYMQIRKTLSKVLPTYSAQCLYHIA